MGRSTDPTNSRKQEVRTGAGNAIGVSRRAALKLGGVLATGALSGLAGCGGLGVGSDLPAFTQWMYEPGTISPGIDSYQTRHFRIQPYMENDDLVPEDKIEGLSGFVEEYLDFVDLKLGAIDTCTLLEDHNIVATGDFDVDALGDRISENGWFEETEHGGFEIFVSDEGPGARLAAAIGSDAVLQHESIDAVQTVIDTKLGEQAGYVDEVGAMHTLASHCQKAAFTALWTHGGEWTQTDVEHGEFKGEVGRAQQTSIGNDQIQHKRVRVFTDADALDINKVKKYVNENTDTNDVFDHHQNLNVEQDGRSAIITGTVDPDDWYGW